MSSFYFPPKICPPRLNGVVARKRLFQSLNEKQVFPVTWISSPAGSGKTTLVGDFAQSTKRPLCWYRFDCGDNDIGSFFHYLTLACKRSYRLSRIKLTAFTPEFDGGLESFSHGFFRDFYAACKSESIFIFDDYHLVSPDSELHRIMQIAISEIPHDMNIFIISRHVPPAYTASLISKKQLAIVDWSQIKFEKNEFNDVFNSINNSSVKSPSNTVLNNIYQQSNGWITGIILLLESNDLTNVHAEKIIDNNMSLVFDYFSAEIKHHINEETLSFLSQVSLMPVVNSENAFKLTKNSHAGNILDKLSNEHLFISKSGLLKANYEFNPLFREYLLQQLNAGNNENTIKSLKETAGLLLLESGNIDEAARVFVESESWNMLEDLINNKAKKYITQGRHMTIKSWMDSMPEIFIASKPWLLFWQGNSILQTNPLAARVLLQQAYDGFMVAEDKKGLYLCWANIIDSFIFGWDSFSPIAEWLEKLQTLKINYPGIPGIETKARVCVAAFTAMLYACPSHADFPLWLKRMKNIFRFVRIDMIRALVGSQLSFYYMLTGDMVRLSTTVFSIASLKRSDKLPALPQLLTAICEVNFYIYSGDLSKAETTLEYALNLAEDKGVCLFNNMLLTLKVHLYGTKHEFDEAEYHLDEFSAQIHPERKLDYAYSLFLSAWLNLMRGNIEQAYYQSSEHEKLVKELCFFYPAMLADLLHAQILIKRSEYETANKHLESCLAEAIKSKTMLIQFMCIGTQVYILLNKDNENNRDDVYIQKLLNNAFLIGRQQKLFFTPIWNAEIMETICQYALKHNIEENYNHQLMKKHGYIKSSSYLVKQHLDWDVKIFTFGDLIIEINGKPYINKSKVKSKPIQLLKVLLSSRSGSLSQSRICELLWPSTEGDLAHQNMKTTLFRLRKIIGANNLLLNDGCLSLNRTTVWADVWNIDELIFQSDGAGRLFTVICELYRGDFLMNDDESWVLSPREEYKLMFVNFAVKYAELLIESGNVNGAISVYEKGLGFDPSSKRLQNGLTQCNSQLGMQEVGQGLSH